MVLLCAVRLLLLLPLVAAVLQCKKGPCSHSNAEYRHLIQQKFKQLQIPKPNTKPEPFTALSFHMVNDFDQIFEKHVVARKPFKAQLTEDPGNSSTWQVVRDCISELKSVGDRAEYSLADCPAAARKDLAGLRLPSLLTSNYISRGNITTAEFEQFRQRQPSALLLGPDAPSAAQQCPSGGHMVLWGATPAEAGAGAGAGAAPIAIKIRVFHAHSALYFEPTDDYLQPGTDADADVGPEALHTPSFRYTGFPKYSPETAAGVDVKAFPKYSEVTLSNPSDLAFVPDGLLMSVIQLSGDTEVPARPATLLKACFFDASNVIAVKGALAVEALSSAPAHQLLQALDNPHFEMHMERAPAELSLAQFRAGHYAGAVTKSDEGTAGEGEIDVGVDGEAPKVAEEVPKPTGRNRRNKKADSSGGSTAASAAEASANAKKARQGALRDWQETKKWNNMITALTLPVPLLPEQILPVGRTSVKLTWASPFRPSGKDMTRFGFNLTVCRLSPEEVDAVAGTSSEPAALNANLVADVFEADSACTTHTLLRGTSQLREFVDVTRSAAVGWEVYTYAAEVPGLRPASYYRYRTTLLYGPSESNPCAWSDAGAADGGAELPHIETAPLSAPEVDTATRPVCTQHSFTSVQCTMPGPTDDGGMDITGVHVFQRHPRLHEMFHHPARNNNSHLPHGWAWHDALLVGTEYVLWPRGAPATITVHVTDISGGASVELAFAYFNAEGNSSQTTPSLAVHLHNRGAELPFAERTRVHGIDYRQLASDPVLLQQFPKPSPLKRIGDALAYAVIGDNNWFVIDGELETLTMMTDQSGHADSNLAHYAGTEAAIAAAAAAPSLVKTVYVGWGFHYAPSYYSVAARVVLPVSDHVGTRLSDVGNDMEGHHPVYAGRIVLVYRGRGPFVMKILHVQARGGVGVIIVDNNSKGDVVSHEGSCSDYTQHCVAGASKRSGERIGLRDKAEPWRKVTIPVIFVTDEIGRDLLRRSSVDLQTNQDPRIQRIVEDMKKSADVGVDAAADHGDL